ncbi:MAG: hypothetical protein CMP84_13955 [Gammaproteobacteria bacterium]|nr:hypothetical protein [Gammaproteobacteria bacterium]
MEFGFIERETALNGAGLAAEIIADDPIGHWIGSKRELIGSACSYKHIRQVPYKQVDCLRVFS